MQPLIAVLLGSDSFSGLWEGLVSSAEGELRQSAAISGLSPLAEAEGVVIAVGGREEEAENLLSELLSEGAGEVVVVGADPNHRLAARLARSGASDYFVLPTDLEPLRSWVKDCVDRGRATARAEGLAEFERASYDFSQLVGESPDLRAALERVARIIPRDRATVLVTGETGTGKELVARAIHYNGPRAAQSLVEVNCTALPASLLESELFGFERGAFTDAKAAKPGLFEAAHGGTLFLDEIGDLSLEVQAKLLKVLEDRQVRRLGSLRAMEVDIRLITATHVDLGSAVRDGRFRQDLYYRLNVVTIHLPPLRERGEDVILLAEHFLDTLSEEYGTERPPLTPKARSALVTHDWPGNVRELRNVIERAVLLGGGEIRPEDVAPLPGLGGEQSALPFPASLDRIDRAAARLAMERTRGNKSAAAELLGISRSRLYRLLESPEDL
jgi:two-component system response regulator HydG